MQGNNGRRYLTYLPPTNDSIEVVGRTPKGSKKKTNRLGKQMWGGEI